MCINSLHSLDVLMRSGTHGNGFKDVADTIISYGISVSHRQLCWSTLSLIAVYHERRTRLMAQICAIFTSPAASDTFKLDCDWIVGTRRTGVWLCLLTVWALILDAAPAKAGNSSIDIAVI